MELEVAVLRTGRLPDQIGVVGGDRGEADLAVALREIEMVAPVPDAVTEGPRDLELPIGRFRVCRSVAEFDAPVDDQQHTVHIRCGNPRKSASRKTTRSRLRAQAHA